MTPGSPVHLYSLLFTSSKSFSFLQVLSLGITILWTGSSTSTLSLCWRCSHFPWPLSWRVCYSASMVSKVCVCVGKDIRVVPGWRFLERTCAPQCRTSAVPIGSPCPPCTSGCWFSLPVPTRRSAFCFPSTPWSACVAPWRFPLSR